MLFTDIDLNPISDSVDFVIIITSAKEISKLKSHNISTCRKFENMYIYYKLAKILLDISPYECFNGLKVQRNLDEKWLVNDEALSILDHISSQ